MMKKKYFQNYAGFLLVALVLAFPCKGVYAQTDEEIAPKTRPVRKKGLKKRKPASLDPSGRVNARFNPRASSSKRTDVVFMGGYGLKDYAGMGTGLKVGHTTQSGLYFGAQGVYRLGSETSQEIGTNKIVVAGKNYSAGADLGYKVRVGNGFVILPYVHAGIVYVSLNGTLFMNGEAVLTANGGGLGYQGAPGLSFSYEFGSWLLGLDSRYHITNDSGYHFFESMGMLGLKF